MKKSLSLILAIAMVFSMFASVAFAAEATTTTTPKTTEEKYDALKALGIFEGDDTGANLTGDMTRAQLAKIVTKLLKVTEDKAANTYTDVPADHWAAGFIGAATTAKAFDGVAPGKFDPEGKVSYQQLATVLVRLTGLAQSTDAVTGKVDEWAKGYVAVAVKELGLSQADYTVNATRGVFVELTFSALPKVVVPGKVSVTEAKATGVKTVEVKFNKAVDTAAAKLELKKGSVVVATTAKFSDDKASAVLTLTDVKIGEGSYTVTLSGLAADAIGTATASFTAEAEKVTKIDFVTTSDTLADSTNVIVKLKPTNQYGENASFSAGSYTVNAKVNNVDLYRKLTRNDAGELLLSLNTSTNQVQAGIGIIPVIVYHNDTRVTATKNFTKGTAAFITKMELGTVKYSNGGSSIGQSGETATFDIINYDQYGNIVPLDVSSKTATQVFVTPYEPKISPEVGDTNNDEIADVKVSLLGNVDKDGDYTLTVYNQAGTNTAKISVKSAKVATKIELGDVADYIAAGDPDAYIPLVAYDANGNKLSADEIVSNENYSRIVLSTGTLVRSGENKGKIKITAIPSQPRSIISVMASIITPNVSSTANKTYTVASARVPDSIKVSTEPAKKIVAGAESDFKFVVYDQYGKELKTFKYVTPNGDVVTSTGAASDVAQYRVVVAATSSDDSIDVYDTVNKVDFSATVTNTTYIQDTYNASTLVWTSNVGSKFNQTHKFVTNAAAISGSAEVSAVVEKSIDGTTWTPVTNKVVRKIEAFDTRNELNYTVNAVSDLYAVISNASESGTIGFKTVHDSTYAASTTALTVGEQTDPALSALAREVTVSAKDTAGNVVAVPKKIRNISTSNTSVLKTGLAQTTGAGQNVAVAPERSRTDEKAYVIGNTKGTATLTVSFATAKDEILVQTVSVNVKDDALAATKIAADSTTKKPTDITTGTTNVFELFGLKVTDNYNKEFKGLTLRKYNYLFGVVFAVKNPDAGSPSIDQYGVINMNGATSFEITATTAAGQSVTLFVSP